MAIPQSKTTDLQISLKYFHFKNVLSQWLCLRRNVGMPDLRVKLHLRWVVPLVGLRLAMAAGCTGTAIWKHPLLSDRWIYIYIHMYIDSETISRHMNTQCIYKNISCRRMNVRIHVHLRKLDQGLPTCSPFLHGHVRYLVDSAYPYDLRAGTRVFRWNLNVNVKKPARIPRCR